jgi:hypothetical protein
MEILVNQVLVDRLLQSMTATSIDSRLKSYTKDRDGDRVSVPPHLNIWAGNKQFCLINFNLTQPEQEWLASELTEWLDLLDRVELQKQKMELRRQKKESRKFPPLSHLNISSNKSEP